MKPISIVFLIIGIFFFQNCTESKIPLSEQDIRLVNNLEEENHKIHDFLMQTEDGMPSVKGLLTSVYSMESSENSYLSGIGKN